jgi:cellulose synthase/poly-beta-1,6-N-acetylglucosamine synthase-like glycosyltransferase
MIILLLRIIEKLLIIYFTLYFVIDIGLFIYSLAVFRRKNRKGKDTGFTDYSGHSVSIIVPAYNEDVSIVHCTHMLLELDYPSFEVILVNDGSRDATLEVLKQNFDFKESGIRNDSHIVTKPIRSIYKSNDGKLILIDKENGGKADSINAGINYSQGNFICTIDADSILDSNALQDVVKPFITYPNTIVTGGQLAAANDVVLVHNKVVSSKTPSNIWVQWQIIEYIKSFMISRIGLSRINALLIMSGAFSLYRKDDLLEIGGFLTPLNTHPFIGKTIGFGKQTVCEDMEIVVRLWQYSRDKKIKAKAVFLPEPVCWTEVPESGKNLFKQRSRWHQGLAETLKIHYKMIFEPAYGVTGLIGLPYYFLFELFSPLIKIFTLVFIVVSASYGLFNYKWAILLITSVMLTTAIILSSITAIIENWSQKQQAVNRDALRYKSYGDWVWLIFAGIIAEFSYSFYKIAAQISGIINFLRGKNNWNKFARKGVKKL